MPGRGGKRGASPLLASEPGSAARRDFDVTAVDRSAEWVDEARNAATPNGTREGSGAPLVTGGRPGDIRRFHSRTVVGPETPPSVHTPLSQML